jgi:hypothetical protein
MSREAIEYPRCVNGRESLSDNYFILSLGKIVCGYWIGFTMQHVLVGAGLAEWKEGDKGVTPTTKGKKVLYDLTFGGGSQYFLLPTGPHPTRECH